MASKSNVENLFELPYFEEELKSIERFAEYYSNDLYEKNGAHDKSLIDKVAEQIHLRVREDMREILVNYFVEAFSDEEIARLHEAFQHPVFLKFRNIPAELASLALKWHEENGESIRSLATELLSKR